MVMVMMIFMMMMVITTVMTLVASCPKNYQYWYKWLGDNLIIPVVRIRSTKTSFPSPQLYCLLFTTVVGNLTNTSPALPRVAAMLQRTSIGRPETHQFRFLLREITNSITAQMIYSIILLLLLSPLLLAADCVRGLRKVDLNFHPNLIFVTNHPQRSDFVKTSIPGQPLSRVPCRLTPSLALCRCLHTDHTHHPGEKYHPPQLLNILQGRPASLSMAPPHGRDGVTIGARPRPLLLLPWPCHQCHRLQELSPRNCPYCLVGFAQS